jgi:hypothetical protein
MTKIKFKNEFDFFTNHNKIKQELVNQIKKDFSQTITLTLLGDKIEHMILNIGCPNSVLPMLQKIASGRLKSLSQPTFRNNEYLGKGHFRWKYSAQILNENELEFLRRYINR